MTTFFQQTAQAMIAKHIDRFPLSKLDQLIDWQRPLQNSPLPLLPPTAKTQTQVFGCWRKGFFAKVSGSLFIIHFPQHLRQPIEHL